MCRVLPQIYEVTRDPIHDHAMALVSLLPLCELTEQLALLQLCTLIANEKPSVSIIIIILTKNHININSNFLVIRS